MIETAKLYQTSVNKNILRQEILNEHTGPNFTSCGSIVQSTEAFMARTGGLPIAQPHWSGTQWSGPLNKRANQALDIPSTMFIG